MNEKEERLKDIKNRKSNLGNLYRDYFIKLVRKQ